MDCVHMAKPKTHLSPLRAVKIWCLECGEGALAQVKSCMDTDCILHDVRLGQKGSGNGMKTKDRIREHCLFCMNGMVSEVNRCESLGCVFYLHRKGSR